MFNWLFGKSQPKKKVSLQQSQKKWKYDALLQFLISKQWKVTILNFIDNNCIVFDNQEQNKFQYTIIHNKFKDLVSGLFDSMMNELGLDHQLLLQLIERGLKSTNNSKIFQQLLYIDDFMKFKQMMLKRNAKLQQQALDQLNKSSINKNNFNVPNSSTQTHNSSNFEPNQQSQQQMLKRIMQLSLRQEQDRKRLRQSQQQQQQNNINNIMRASQIQKDKTQRLRQQQQQQFKNAQKQSQRQNKKSQKLNQLKNKKQQLELKKRQEEQLLLERQLQKQKQQEQRRRNAQLIRKQQLQKQQLQKQKLASQKIEKQQQNKIDISPEMIQQRKRRLFEQRQILRKKKMEQRNQEMEKNDGKQVQTILLGQNGVQDSRIGSKEIDNQEKIPQSQIDRRRQLMKRIKNKIVEDY